MFENIKTKAVSAVLLVTFLLQSFMFNASAMNNVAINESAPAAGMNSSASAINPGADITDIQGDEPTAVMEDVAKRDEFTKHYQMSDGGFDRFRLRPFSYAMVKSL